MRHSLWKRFVLFVRYDVTGIISFIAELALLYALLNVVLLPYYLAVPLAFTITSTLHWVGCHFWVFECSHRPGRKEYEYFISILLCGLAFATAFVVLIVRFFGIDPFIARILSGVFTGVWGFYLNARFNFRSRLFK